MDGVVYYVYHRSHCKYNPLRARDDVETNGFLFERTLALDSLYKPRASLSIVNLYSVCSLLSLLFVNTDVCWDGHRMTLFIIV